MSTPSRLLIAALALLAARPAAAQDSTKRVSVDSMMKILRLPRTTTEARQRGVPDTSIGAVIDILRRGGVPAGDADEILQREVEAVAAGQPTDNFGAFVQEQHRRGLRGRALADAIHAEQARRGMGRGNAKAGEGAERGRRPDAAKAAPGRRKP